MYCLSHSFVLIRLDLISQALLRGTMKQENTYFM